MAGSEQREGVGNGTTNPIRYYRTHKYLAAKNSGKNAKISTHPF
jgi:hypothetical protein